MDGLYYIVNLFAFVRIIHFQMSWSLWTNLLLQLCLEVHSTPYFKNSFCWKTVLQILCYICHPDSVTYIVVCVLLLTEPASHFDSWHTHNLRFFHHHDFHIKARLQINHLKNPVCSIQDIAILFNVIIILLMMFNTYVFQVGLVSLLLERFRALLIFSALYLTLSICFHCWVLVRFQSAVCKLSHIWRCIFKVFSFFFLLARTQDGLIQRVLFGQMVYKLFLFFREQVINGFISEIHFMPKLFSCQSNCASFC